MSNTTVASPTAPKIPPLDQLSLIGIWVETLLYGMNVLLFGACVIILARKGFRSRSQKALLALIVTLFALATLHVACSLVEALEAFIDTRINGIPDGSLLYWLDFTHIPTVIKTETYIVSVLIQDLVLMWRLYVVWNQNWKIIVIPFIIDIAHNAIAFIGSILLLVNPDSKAGPRDALGLAGWSIDLAINIAMTAGIAFRLWWMGRRVSALVPSTLSWSPQQSNKYAATIYTVIESGAIFCACTVVIVALFIKSGTTVLLSAVNVATQLAALTPFLIVVRVGLGFTHGGPRRRPQTTSTGMRSELEFRHTPPVEVSISHATNTDRTEVGTEYQLDDFKPSTTSLYDRKVNEV